MKRLTIVALILLLSLTITQCYYDKFDELHPLDGYINTCDPSLAATYTSSIDLIIRSNCISCHNNKRGDGGVYLETYTQVKTEGTNGRLVGATSHSSGYKAMPPGTKIRDCELEAIKNWVEIGMPE